MVNLHKLRLADGMGFPRLWNRLLDELQRNTIASVASPLMLSQDTSGQRLGIIMPQQQQSADAKRFQIGVVQADFTTGTTISVKSSDSNGVTSGDAFNVTIPTSWGTVNLASAAIGGTATAVTCKVASGALLAYAYAADGTAYLVGVPPFQVQTDFRLSATDMAYQIRVAFLFGSTRSTESDWQDVVIVEETDKISCTQPGS